MQREKQRKWLIKTAESLMGAAEVERVGADGVFVALVFPDRIDFAIHGASETRRARAAWLLLAKELQGVAAAAVANVWKVINAQVGR